MNHMARLDFTPECIVLLVSEVCTAIGRIKDQEAASLFWAVLTHLSKLTAGSLSLRRRNQTEMGGPEKGKGGNFPWPLTGSGAWPLAAVFVL